MIQPLATAILLTRDRPQMARRALACFRAQTYANKALVILDQSDDLAGVEFAANEVWSDGRPFLGSTIADLRNIANTLAKGADILVHWDSDDWSAPDRIAQQVTLLSCPGYEAVGFVDALFWRPPAAWRWRSSEARTPRLCLGASLAYHRRAWERVPFTNPPHSVKSTGEDYRWQQRATVRGFYSQDQLICAIHPGNTSDAYDIEGARVRGDRQWTRAPEWDAYCREKMAL